jgi:hypothetical protein
VPEAKAYGEDHVRPSVSVSEQLLSAKNTIFWDITPCSPSNVNRRFGGTVPEMKAIYSSETPVDFQRTTRRYIPEASKR